jgi:hypothetical protein
MPIRYRCGAGLAHELRIVFLDRCRMPFSEFPLIAFAALRE